MLFYNSTCPGKICRNLKRITCDEDGEDSDDPEFEHPEAVLQPLVTGNEPGPFQKEFEYRYILRPIIGILGP